MNSLENSHTGSSSHPNSPDGSTSNDLPDLPPFPARSKSDTPEDEMAIAALNSVDIPESDDTPNTEVKNDHRVTSV